MMGLIRIRNFIKNFDEREAYKYIGATLGVIMLLLALILWNYYSGIQRLQMRLKSINRQREETRAILEKNEQVRQQQIHVDEVLERDKNFKIKEYFMAVVQQLGLTQLISKDADITSNELVAGYTEIKLDVSFSNLNMRQLIELLYNIEQNERVYTKDLKITKSLRAPVIDVSLVIATFEATATTG